MQVGIVFFSVNVASFQHKVGFMQKNDFSEILHFDYVIKLKRKHAIVYPIIRYIMLIIIYIRKRFGNSVSL